MRIHNARTEKGIRVYISEAGIGAIDFLKS